MREKPGTEDLLDDNLRFHPGAVRFDYWFFVGLGTVIAGGVFGLLTGGGIGLFVGPILAGYFYPPVVLFVATLSWALWLERWPWAAGAFGGASTGLLATVMRYDFLSIDPPLFAPIYGWSLFMAAAIGATCAGMVGQWRWRAIRRTGRSIPAVDGDWSFSLSDMLLRVTVVALLCLIAGAALPIVRDQHLTNLADAQAKSVLTPIPGQQAPGVRD